MIERMAKTSSKSGIQGRVSGKGVIEDFFRHLGRLTIDLDDEEIEVEATFPDESHPFGLGNYEVQRTLDLEHNDDVREAVKALVRVVQEAVLETDKDYDPNRCDRCVKSDCCHIDRIHLNDAERRRILEHLGLEDTPKNNKRYFDDDDDLAGYYTHVMKHSGDPAHCIFLKPVKGIMRCSIYEARPQVCRDYDAGYCTEYSKLLPKKRVTRV